MRDEARLLIDLCDAELDAESAAHILETLNTRSDVLAWPWFLDQAVTHRVACLVGRNLNRYDLCPTSREPGMWFPYRALLTSLYAANAQRNEELVRELAVVTAALADGGVLAVLRKGPVLLHELYHDVGVRQMKDLDIMVHPDDTTRAKEILGELGYAEGTRSRNGRRLAPIPRRVEVFQRLHMPNVLMHRPSASRFVDWFTVDISLNQFLPGSGWSIPTTDLPDRSRRILLYGFPVHVLTPEHQLLDLATHLYKEATTLMYVHAGKDLCLYKFLDIALAGRSGEIDWAEFVRLVHVFDVAVPVYLSCYFATVLYPDAIPADVLAGLRPDDVSYLDKVGSAEGAEYEWRTDFLTRLFDPDRAREAPLSKSPL
jgi:putative nucleotidyltransferase-like protein